MSSTPFARTLSMPSQPHRLGAVGLAIVMLILTTTGCRNAAESSDQNQPTPASDDAATDSMVAPDAVASAGSAATATPTNVRRRKVKFLGKLSEYGLFRGELAQQKAAEGVVEYDLNSPLFTDYAAKKRFVKLPAGTSAPYNADEYFEFPVGTVIAKTFAHLHDMNDPGKGRYNMETRILLRQASGWIGLPYIWNAEQTEAKLSLSGGAVDVQWIHTDGQQRQMSHLVPNVNDCKRCHVDNQPIGPKARHINRDFAYPDGVENQIAHWSRIGILSGAPDPQAAPRLADWDDPGSGTLDERARAWLEINCAHCHSETGPARNSGLYMHASVSDPFRLGVFKGPVAAGKGTGGRSFDIVPGKPDESILMYRLETTHPGEVMPEFGRSMVDEEANALIRQWIRQMDDQGRVTEVTRLLDKQAVLVQ